MVLFKYKALMERRRMFNTSDLAKMKTVYPTALLLAQHTHIPGGYSREIFNSYQLTIECNLAELADDDRPVNNSTKHLASSVLLRRRQKFKRNLVTVVKRHHKVHDGSNEHCNFIIFVFEGVSSHSQYVNN